MSDDVVLQVPFNSGIEEVYVGYRLDGEEYVLATREPPVTARLELPVKP